ncbi:Methyltransferase-like protein 21B [Balamuthia mandrillaris]
MEPLLGGGGGGGGVEDEAAKEQMQQVGQRKWECFEVRGKQLIVHQIAGFSTTGGTVWDCAIVLQKLLQRNYFGELSGKRLIDLGSGTGMLGLACALLGCHVTLTDTPQQLPLLTKNVEANKQVLLEGGEGSTTCYLPTVIELTWGQTDLEGATSDFASNRPYDVVLCSDLLFCAHKYECLPALLHTMLALCLPPSSSATQHLQEEKNKEEEREAEEGKEFKPRVVFGFQERLPWVERAFMKELALYFRIEEVPVEELDLACLRRESEEEYAGMASMFHEDPDMHIYLLFPLPHITAASPSSSSS